MVGRIGVDGGVCDYWVERLVLREFFRRIHLLSSELTFRIIARCCVKRKVKHRITGDVDEFRNENEREMILENDILRYVDASLFYLSLYDFVLFIYIRIHFQYFHFSFHCVKTRIRGCFTDPPI